MPLNHPHTRHRLLPIALLAAAGLALLAGGPASARTYVAVLKHTATLKDHVQITNPEGVFGIPAAGFGSHVDKAFITAPRATKADMDRFAPAIEAMNAILAAGLPELPHSYAALLGHSAGPLGSLRVQVKDQVFDLQEDGQAVLINSFVTAPFKIDPKRVEADFGAALTSMNEAHAAATAPRTYVLLLQSPDGTVGKVRVTDARGTVLIEEAGQAVNLDVTASRQSPFEADKAQADQDFGPALEARPPLPVDYTFNFQTGKTQFTDASKQEFEKFVEVLRARPAPNILIKGHADTVGHDALNERLSQTRAEFIATQLKGLGIPPEQIEILAFGERSLLIKTPDNTSEERNRRVEVHVW
jgi:peptidoglycan-associated lipoprotein